MKIVEISYGVSQKINLGNYQTKLVSIGAKAQLSDEDNTPTAMDRLIAFVDAQFFEKMNIEKLGEKK